MKINGVDILKETAKEVTATTHTKYYELELSDSSIVALNVTAQGSEDDNICINNERFKGNAKYQSILNSDGTGFVRIIAQNGEKEPVTYIIKCKGGGNPSINADLSALTLTPGDETIKASAITDDTFRFNVANSVEKDCT